MLWGLVIAFALTAVVYASAGFGGGSTYTALLAARGVDASLLPILSLSCNVLVVAGSTWRHAWHGLVPWRGALPLLVLSVPMAWLGARVAISEEAFLTILGLALFAAALLMFIQPTEERVGQRLNLPPAALYAVGGGTGFLSGMVGIGGGIFLAPILYLTAWDAPRRIAATASVFILLNSLAGLAGQLSKSGAAVMPELWRYLPLAVAVLVGGQLGARFGVGRLGEPLIRRVTGVLVLIVALRLLWGVFSRNMVGS